MEKVHRVAFGRERMDAWNSQDLERILSLYSEDVQMQSEYIRTVANETSGILVGKDGLRAYWGEALRRLPDLRFTHIATCMGIDLPPFITKAWETGWPSRHSSSMKQAWSGKRLRTMDRPCCGNGGLR